MRSLVALVALAAAGPAPAQDLGTHRPGTIGEAPVVPAGWQAAPLHPDPGLDWRYALSTGLAGRFGGRQLSSEHDNANALLYFGGQVDGYWPEGYGQAARVRFRLFTGGESGIYVPSDGEVEAAYMMGRREFRFVVGRIELARDAALGFQTLAQFATLPCFEGSLSLAGDASRLYYYLSPIEGAWVYYHGSAHIEHSAEWATESDSPSAATAARLRYTLLLPPAVLVSAQADFMKMWRKADLLLAAEGSVGYQAFQQSAVFNATVRWNHYTRRGLERDTSESESEVLVLGTATLAF